MPETQSVSFDRAEMSAAMMAALRPRDYEYETHILGLGTDLTAAFNGYARAGWRVVNTLLVPSRPPLSSMAPMGAAAGAVTTGLLVILERDAS